MKLQVNRAYNFNAGPSALPLSVLEKAQEELLDFRRTGMSVMELSHRSKAYEEVHNHAIDSLRELLSIPDDYKVLFLQGGASLQFSMIPMNFLQAEKKAAYVMTGSWSEKAFSEAKLLGEVYYAASTKDGNYRSIPKLKELQYHTDDAYLHITSNNTIYGTQWKEFPNTGGVPLIADMSSDILSKPIDVNNFALIYAGAQKNLGPSGVTVVIIRKDFLEQANTQIPTMLKYSTHAKNNSLYNTPPTFGIYMLSEVLNWAKELGGLDVIADLNEKKAKLIYDVIDTSNGFYLGHAEQDYRSLMNITFNLKTPELEKSFLEKAKQEGFIGVNGHRSIGGCRVSAYNAVPIKGCQAFREFMIQFQKENY
ncbi:3-phosphoserine/phosphohydroxythreonine transaminase [Neobacillus massiliamazoniensis]|uniref:Phosphoserine aminotransferase n=1 Tax=Neobacillus massiliamazoniensis TaxID=1499688 RepID=A0A0U1NSU8_9BACI|nr:3-phosphoserine/phosphohydroxythreonine transaminase [Neobacillus massiliamazoniensis]CRK80798.1 phosphoserine aminotransferase [Neobacillus massiliamazoniensis]